MEKNPDPAQALAGMVNASGRLTPVELCRRAREELGIPRAGVRRALKGLVERGVFEYACENATVFLVPSLAAPVGVGRRLFLLRPGQDAAGLPEGALPVVLREGASFGSGRHPTTRLCLALIEDAVEALPEGLRDCCLDLGTGSGVLAIAAVRLGMRSAVALDLDPSALFEARENAALNGVDGRIAVSGADFRGQAGAFGLILANLRAPTLFSLLPVFAERLPCGGFLAASGLHPDEASDYAASAAAFGLSLAGRRDLGCWSGVSFQKRTG